MVIEDSYSRPNLFGFLHWGIVVVEKLLLKHQSYWIANGNILDCIRVLLNLSMTELVFLLSVRWKTKLEFNLLRSGLVQFSFWDVLCHLMFHLCKSFVFCATWLLIGCLLQILSWTWLDFFSAFFTYCSINLLFYCAFGFKFALESFRFHDINVYVWVIPWCTATCCS